MARMARAPAMRLALSDTADREAFDAALDHPLGEFPRRRRVPCPSTFVIAGTAARFQPSLAPTVDGGNAQTPAICRPLGERVKPTQGDIRADTATVAL